MSLSKVAQTPDDTIRCTISAIDVIQITGGVLEQALAHVAIVSTPLRERRGGCDDTTTADHFVKPKLR